MKIGNSHWSVIVFMIVALGAWGLAGCGGGDDDDDNDDGTPYGDDDDDSDWRSAVPDPASLTLSLPGEDSSGAKSLGELATLYDATVDFTREVNGYILYFLSVIDEITSYPVTSETNSEATWGPWIEDGLSPVEMQFVMTRVEGSSYTYRLEWRPKDSGAAWSVVWSGGVEASTETERRGVGQFTMDFTAAWELDPTINERGVINVDYDTLTDGRLITIGYDEFCPDQNDADNEGIPCPVNAEYFYHNHGDNSGEFEFDYYKDVHFEEYGGTQYPDYERVWMNTRWQSDGTGRSDLSITDGDMDEFEYSGNALESYTAAECWGSDFLTDFYEEIATWENLGPAPVASEGDEADCAFEQELPVTE